MKMLHHLVPDTDDLLALEPEELGGFILQCLNSAGAHEAGNLNRATFTQSNLVVQHYSPGKRLLVQRALNEAWSWLVSDCLIAPDPSQMGGNWVFVTRRGEQLRNENEFESYYDSRALNHELLHPRITERCLSAFSRRDYDAAIFLAFKEVEVVVRDAGKLPENIIGTNLMRKAFGEKGALAQVHLASAEREAISNLFCGAIGWFKNPQSHRIVGTTSKKKTVQALMFASYLLEEVDAVMAQEL